MQHAIANPRVEGSIPSLPTTNKSNKNNSLKNRKSTTYLIRDCEGIGVRVLATLAGHRNISIIQRYADVNGRCAEECC